MADLSRRSLGEGGRPGWVAERVSLSRQCKKLPTDFAEDPFKQCFFLMWEDPVNRLGEFNEGGSHGDHKSGCSCYGNRIFSESVFRWRCEKRPMFSRCMISHDLGALFLAR